MHFIVFSYINTSVWILQVDATESEPKSFIYMSEDALTNPDKLLVLIQGSGVVRAGQWARRLIINEDLDSGTQIPFISKAMQVNAPTLRLYALDALIHGLVWMLTFQFLRHH